MYLWYNLILKLITILLWPLLALLALCVPLLRKGLWTRLGHPPYEKREAFMELPRPRAWFHAASVGELSAIAPIAAAFKDRCPSASILVSCMTQTGLQLAQTRMVSASIKFLVPLDYPGAVRRMLRLIEPDLLVIAETELWPNLVREAKRFGCQLALVNGRMSERSFRRYRWVKGLLRPILSAFDLVAVQSEADAERFMTLGANSQRLKITGNVKFDVEEIPDYAPLAKELRLSPQQPVWVAGSTRPGEEAIILDAFLKVREQVPNAVLILAPRHLERLREVEQLLTAKRLTFTRRTRAADELIDFPVILLDTMGELAHVYALGRVAFVGASLVSLGGHNPLEPAAAGVPVLFGQYMHHFAKVAEILKTAGGAQVVYAVEDLAAAVTALLQDPVEAKRRGKLARQAVTTHRGAAVQSAEMLKKLMLIKRWRAEVSDWRQEASASNAFTQSKDRYQDNWPE